MLLGEAERHQVVEEWNATEAAYPKDRCVHELFEEQAARSAEAVALVHEDRQVSYGELNRRANQLGHHLRRLGVGPETRVAICMERSVEMVIGLLGALKAGGAYVPLDPAYQTERLAYMLEDSAPLAVLTQSQVELNLPSTLTAADLKVIDLEADTERWASESDDNPDQGSLNLRPSNLAYVIYTSGSTGKPKGVAIEHRQIINYVGAIIERLGIGPDAKFAMVQPLSFDSCATVIYPALSTGGSLHVVSRERAIDPQAFGEYFSHHEIDCLKITPSHLGAMQRGVDAEKVLPRQMLVIGGESSSTEWVEKLRKMKPQCRILSHYGPTEATVGMLTYDVEQDRTERCTTVVPIGHPLENTQAYVLDRWLQPVPTGVVGELYTGGLCVARGYLNHPETTAEKFIPHLYGKEPGGRLYKTGDQVRYLPDGNIEFLGRLDQQVKIRGFRIELGEIEAALLQHKAIREAVVIATGEVGEEKRLVAYLVSAKGEQLGLSELRSFLKRRLPDYMTPSSFVPMEKLPLMPNGKLDRGALPASGGDAYVRREYEAPIGEIETALARIWGELLKVERVSRHDNFFELGGHSLLAVQVMSRLRQEVGVEVGLAGLFERPMLADLAQIVERSAPAELPPIRRVDRQGLLELSFAQQRLWFIHQLEPGSSAYNIPKAVRLRGALDIHALRQSLQEIARRHEVLRTRFEPGDGCPAQVIDKPDEIEFPIWDLSGMKEREREERAREIVRKEAQRPFDLERGPVWRVAVARLKADEHILLFCIHHVASDGWSTRLMVKEFSALYEAYRNGACSNLPELPIQYVDYARWQRDWLQGATLDGHLAYWKRQLEGAPALIELPTDYPRPARLGHHGAMLTVDLPAETIEQFRELSRREGVTLFMALLAAWNVLLMSYSKQQDIVVGTNVAGRNRAELEGLIGFFVNALALRTDLSGDPTFRELLSRVRKVCLDAYAHQDVPFEKLVDELNPKRSLSYHPIYQVKLDFQSLPRDSASFSGLDLAGFEDEAVVSRYDLALTIVEREQSLVGHWVYSPSLFNASAIQSMAGRFESLLKSIVAQHETRIGSLNLLTEVEKRKQAEEEARRAENNFKKFRSIKPKGVKMLQEALVKLSPLSEGKMLPLLAQPTIEGLDLIAWAEVNKDFITEHLRKHGAILFRNFNIWDTDKFEQFIRGVSGQLLEYKDRSSPRSQIAGNIYNSTDYPADRAIFLHNENSYSHTWPMKLFFFCITSAERGGETPIADARRIYTRLSRKVRERFAEKRVMYVRNFGDGFGLSWQTAFQTTDKSAVERFCHSCGIETEWKENDRLRTRQVRLAIARHPRTDETVWFNHIAFFHISSLDAPARETLLAELREEDLPYNTYYGDGSQIESSVLDEIRDAYHQETVAFSWRPTDILMIDNMLTAHGRTAYEGPRKIAVAMTEAFTIDDVQAPNEIVV
jgi:amino acid adenylation domain-containing protein